MTQGHSFRSQQFNNGYSLRMVFQIIVTTLNYDELPGWLSSKESACQAGDTGDMSLIPVPGGGNGNPLQYRCLENSMDRGVEGCISLSGKFHGPRSRGLHSMWWHDWEAKQPPPSTVSSSWHIFILSRPGWKMKRHFLHSISLSYQAGLPKNILGYFDMALETHEATTIPFYPRVFNICP